MPEQERNSALRPEPPEADPAEMKSRPDSLPLHVRAAWLIFLGCVAYVGGYVLPRAGIDFSDEGWLLTEAMLTAKGADFLPLVAQSADRHLLGLFMRMGITDYLAFRYINLLLIIATSWLFLSGILQRRFNSLAVPMGMSLCMFFLFRTIPSYNNSPLFLLAGGIGCTAWAVHASGHSRLSLCALAAGLLCMAGMFNISLAPAISLTPLILAAVYRNRTALLVLLLYAALYAISLAAHIFGIGPEVFFSAPGGHELNFKPIDRLWDILAEWPWRFWLPALLAASVLRAALFKRRWSTTVYNLILVLLAVLSSAWFLSQIIRTAFGTELLQGVNEFLTEHKATFPWATSLTKAGIVPAAAIWGWAFCSLTSLWSLAAVRRQVLPLVSAAIFLAVWFNKMLFSLMPPIMSGIYSTPLMLATGLALLEGRSDDRGPLNGAVCKGGLWCVFLLALVGGVLFSLNVNHVGMDPITEPGVYSEIPKLRGVKISPDLEAGLKEIRTIYEQNHCSDGLFLTFDSTPLLHYILGANPKGRLAYIRSRYLYPETEMFDALEQASCWCVAISENEAEKGWHKTEPVLEYLKNNASRHIVIDGARPSKSQGRFEIYIGPRQ